MSSQDFDAIEKLLAIYSTSTTISIDTALFVNYFLQESTLSKDSSHLNLVVSILMLPCMSSAHDIRSIYSYLCLAIIVNMQNACSNCINFTMMNSSMIVDHTVFVLPRYILTNRLTIS